MKKIITCALIFAMLLTTFAGTMTFGASAAEITNVPGGVFAQKTATTQENTQNIRFVSEVSSAVLEEEINALGFDVIATFKDTAGNVEQVSYNIEGTSVYTSLNATNEDGVTNKVEPKTGYLFFALTLKGVPTNLGDVFFDVRTYSRLDENKTYAAKNAMFCFANGEVATRTLIYANGFDSLAYGDYYNRAKNGTASVSRFEELGFIGVTPNNWDAEGVDAAKMVITNTENQVLNVNGYGDIFDLLDADDLAAFSEYTVDIDMKIWTLGNLAFKFDADDANTALWFREMWWSPSKGNIWAQGGADVSGSSNNCIVAKLDSASTFNESTMYNFKKYTSGTENNTERTNAVKHGEVFKLSINVVKATGQITVSLNGNQIITRTFSEITNPVLKLQTQTANVNLDNIMIYGTLAAN